MTIEDTLTGTILNHTGYNMSPEGIKEVLETLHQDEGLIELLTEWVKLKRAESIWSSGCDELRDAIGHGWSMDLDCDDAIRLLKDMRTAQTDYQEAAIYLERNNIDVRVKDKARS